MLTGHKELGITWICDAVNSATVLGDPKHEVELVNMKIPTPDDKHNEMYADALWMRGSYYQNYSFAWSPLSNSSMGSFRLAWEIPLVGPKWHTRRHIWVFATLKVEGSNICLCLIIHWELNMQTGWTSRRAFDNNQPTLSSVGWIWSKSKNVPAQMMDITIRHGGKLHKVKHEKKKR